MADGTDFTIELPSRLLRDLAAADEAQENVFTAQVEIVKQGGQSWAGILADETSHSRCFVKCYQPAGLSDRLLVRAGLVRPYRVYQLGRRLSGQFPVAAPLAILRNRNSLNVYTFFQFLQGADFARSMRSAGGNSAKVAELLQAAGQQLAQLHHSGWVHGDFKWTNIMLLEGEQDVGERLRLVDLDSVRPLRWPGRMRGRDLARFIVNGEDFGMDDDTLDQFITAYAQAMGETPQCSLAVARGSLKKLRRRHRAQYGESV